MDFQGAEERMAYHLCVQVVQNKKGEHGQTVALLQMY